MNLNALSSEIDLDATLDRLCGDTSLLLEILDLFLAEFSAEPARLGDRVNAGEYAELASKAHYFKGIAQNLGLMNFLPNVIMLEQAAKQADAASCLEAIDSLNKTAAHLLSLRKDAEAA
mgnify:CR=1 FL=1